MTTETGLYAIDWGDGTRTIIGEDRAYAEYLLRESSGPFSAFRPKPAVVALTAFGGDDPGSNPLTEVEGGGPHG